METKTKAIILSYIAFFIFGYFNVWCFLVPIFEDSEDIITSWFPPKELAGEYQEKIKSFSASEKRFLDSFVLKFY